MREREREGVCVCVGGGGGGFRDGRAVIDAKRVY